MKEQDKRAVEGMARCGISVEGLIGAFPKFDSEEIKAIYNEIHKNEITGSSLDIKMNCS